MAHGRMSPVLKFLTLNCTTAMAMDHVPEDSATTATATADVSTTVSTTTGTGAPETTEPPTRRVPDYGPIEAAVTRAHAALGRVWPRPPGETIPWVRSLVLRHLYHCADPVTEI